MQVSKHVNNARQEFVWGQSVRKVGERRAGGGGSGGRRRAEGGGGRRGSQSEAERKGPERERFEGSVCNLLLADLFVGLFLMIRLFRSIRYFIRCVRLVSRNME